MNRLSRGRILGAGIGSPFSTPFPGHYFGAPAPLGGNSSQSATDQIRLTPVYVPEDMVISEIAVQGTLDADLTVAIYDADLNLWPNRLVWSDVLLDQNDAGPGWRQVPVNRLLGQGWYYMTAVFFGGNGYPTDYVLGIGSTGYEGPGMAPYPSVGDNLSNISSNFYNGNSTTWCHSNVLGAVNDVASSLTELPSKIVPGICTDYMPFMVIQRAA